LRQRQQRGQGRGLGGAETVDVQTGGQDKTDGSKQPPTRSDEEWRVVEATDEEIRRLVAELRAAQAAYERGQHGDIGVEVTVEVPVLAGDSMIAWQGGVAAAQVDENFSPERPTPVVPPPPHNLTWPQNQFVAN
jgi:hypothetical protein